MLAKMYDAWAFPMIVCISKEIGSWSKGDRDCVQFEYLIVWVQERVSILQRSYLEPQKIT